MKKARTIPSAAGSPSRSPWNAGIDHARCGQAAGGQGNCVGERDQRSASAPGGARAACAANRAPTWLTDPISVWAPEVPNGDRPPTNQIHPLQLAPGHHRRPLATG